MNKMGGKTFWSSLMVQRDPRTADWPLVGNVSFLLTLLVGYVYIVKIATPRFMKGRPAYENLKPVIRIYNLAEVILNAVFIANLFPLTYMHGRYNLLCQGVDLNDNNPEELQVLSLCWWYFWLRIADLLDTLFFALRKKDEHVSFLHVAHHCIVVSIGWYGLAFGTGGQGMFGVLLNSFVHVIMYSYYFLASFGPAMQPYLFWKRYLTQFQIIQFACFIVHSLIPLFYSCNYPTMHVLITLAVNIFFITMFLRFYMKSYKNTKKTRETANGSLSCKINGTNGISTTHKSVVVNKLD